MADKRISQLIERTNIANNDVLPIVASGATTTNKVTVSTLQDWMQDNLDVGVTSVGITIGSTGTDVNVTGSPVTSSGNITINIPTASATNRGLLSSADWSTFNNKVSSVGLSMPSAFSVANSPITGSGTIAVTGAGTVAQYIRGDGSLADFPSGGGGGGSSVSYYLNGSVSQGTIGGIAYKEMNKTPVLGAGTDFVAIADGYLASFITDAGDPALLEIPAGNWNFETYFSASSGGGSPSFYIELYKVNSGGTATLIASNSATPELISFGTSISPYFSPLAVPTTVLTVTDRLAVRYYVARSGRTITLHTENSHLCQIITTFTTGLTALNGLTAQVQNFATGTSGTDFAISSSVSTHTFNLPTASATNRGALSSADWTTFNNKANAADYVTLATTQTITAQKTFTTSGGSDSVIITTTGAGFALDAIKAGNGEVIRVNKTSGTGNAMTVIGGNFEAPTIVKTGGTSSQFLKADGSVDSNAYTTNTGTVTSVSGTGTVSGLSLSGTVTTSGNLTLGGTLSLTSANVTDALGFTPYNATNPAGYTTNVGTVTSVAASAGTGISISGSPITSSGTLTITNTAPDQVVSLTASTGISVTGTYPNFTITNTSPASGSGITGTGISGRLPIFTGTNTISSSNIDAVGATIYNLNPVAGQFAWTFFGSPTTGQSYGALVASGTNSSDTSFECRNQSGSPTLFKVRGDGNVGIGTASPTAKLQITSTSAGADTVGLFLNNNSTTSSTETRIAFAANTNDDIATNRYSYISALNTSGSNGQALIFATNETGAAGTERMRITSDGNIKYTSNNASAASFDLNYKFSTPDSARIRFSTTTSFNLNEPGELSFWTRANDAQGGGNITERMRITSEGFLKAKGNETTYSNLAGPYHELRSGTAADWTVFVSNASGNPYGLRINYPSVTPNNSDNWLIYCDDLSAVRFRVASNGNVQNQNNSYGAISDIKLKENIEDATPKLDDLMKVKVRNYNLIGDDKKQIGVIAQELEEVFPAMIDESEDFEEVEVPQLDEEGNEVLNEEGEVVTEKQRVSKGTSTKSVKYSVFVPMLIKAVQELKTEIDSLKNQIK